MQREISLGTVSWINDTPNPVYTTLQTQVLTPDWVPKTYVGLAGTANSPPPGTLKDFKAHQKARDFRAMTFCKLRLDIDDATKKVTGVDVLDAFHDGGWTPAFKMSKFPSTVFSFDMSIYSTTWYQGEYSPLSVVNTQARHSNTVITGVPADETVLVNALIKFRAGKHTDDIGVNKVGTPFHVPWVWCEALLTYGNGQFKAYGRGSLFPTHAWYVDGKQVKTISQTADMSFPLTTGPVPMLAVPMPGVIAPQITPKTTIDLQRLKIYPVLAKGAPSSGAQASISAESSLKGAVDQHPNTVSGGAAWNSVIS
jgi:hypothetical protein